MQEDINVTDTIAQSKEDYEENMDYDEMKDNQLQDEYNQA